MFTKILLDYKHNLFHELLNQTEFEDITKGRKGGVLVNIIKEFVPIVRTTTKYINPAQKFKPLHYDIMNKIRDNSKLDDIGFNNALIEVYDNQYCTMGFHSDQALDLAENSYIAIYSCYEYPVQNARKLIIKNKKTNHQSELTMEHDSVIIFSTNANQEHLHKIILENIKDNNRWIGITFRLSKSFVKFVDNVPFLNNNVLTSANEEEIKNFYKLRSEENKSIEYKYPKITYTISQSDLLVIK